MWALVRPDAVAVLRDEKARRSLKRYFDVMADRKPANFMIARRLEASFSEDDSLGDLWKEHDSLVKEFYELQREIDEGGVKFEELSEARPSFLDLKVAIAYQILRKCHFCVRRCGVDRLAGERGYCRAGAHILVSSMFDHLGEEPELVPSFTVFTMGCNMTCKHCQNWTISQWYEAGEALSHEAIARAIDRARRRGCRNVNMVGGEPTVWAHAWFDIMRKVRENVPVVWNSNSYYSEELARLLAGFADVYLLDFKYGNNECAKRISNASKYWEACTRNHLYAKKFGELIIRILVLPEHLECCLRPIVEWIARNLGEWIRVNVMFQYRPEWRAHEIPELRRRLTRSEKRMAVQIAEEAGLRNFIT